MCLIYPTLIVVLFCLKSVMSDSITIVRPRLWRHLIVIVYDLLLLFGCLFFATLFIVALNGGESIPSGNPFFILYLVFVSLFFYGWFWRHGGQTLGMRAWHVSLISLTGKPLTLKQIILRFFGSLFSWLPLGIGVWWAYLSHSHQSWSDRLSDTALHHHSD